MVQTRNVKNEKVTERRSAVFDRRCDEDRRNAYRKSQMQEECRSAVPRRGADIEGSSMEVEMWWSNSQQFF